MSHPFNQHSRPVHPPTKPGWVQRLQDAAKERWWPESEPGPDESQNAAPLNWILHALADWVFANLPDDAPLEIKWQIETARRDPRLAKQLLMEAIALGQAPFVAKMNETERDR
jgi:hypothetical protein